MPDRGSMPAMVGTWAIDVSGIALMSLAVLGVGACGLLWWAVRGRREAVPPSCRACEYDVSGRPADSTRCSECGADLSTAGSVVTHFRRPRWTLVIVALSVLVAAGSVGIGGAVRLPWRWWWLAHEPTWVIRREARADLWPGGDAYRGEWYRREGTSPALIDHLLDLQANVAGPFHGSWNDVLLDAFDRPGAMSQAQRERYGRQTFAPAPTVSVRDPVRIGDPLHASIVWPIRGQYGWRLPNRMRTDIAVRLDGAVDEMWFCADHPVTVDLPLEKWAGGGRPPALGPHRLSWAVRRTIATADDHRGSTIDPVLVTGHLPLRAIPAGVALGTPIYDATVAATIGSDFTISAETADGSGPDVSVAVTITPQSLPVDVAFRVCIVRSGREVTIGQLAAPAGPQAYGGGGPPVPVFAVPRSAWPSASHRTLTIALVSDGEALVRTLNQRRYWAGRIVYPDVPVRARGFSQTTWPSRVEPEGPK